MVIRCFRIVRLLVLLAVSACSAFPSSAAPKIQPQLWLANDSAKPGETVMAGVYLKFPTGWHTYWQNPGDSGQAARLKWTLPPGVTADPIVWTIPEKDLAGAGDFKLYTYVLREECLLLVPMHIDPKAAPGPFDLSVNVTWQECADSCVIRHGDAKATLTVGDSDLPAPHAKEIEAWQKKLPQPALAIPIHVSWTSPVTDSNRVFAIEWNDQAKSIDFFPFRDPNFTVHGDTRLERLANGAVRLIKTVEKDSGDWPQKLGGLIVDNPGAPEASGYVVSLDIANNGSNSPPAPGVPVSASTVTAPPVVATPSGANLSLIATLFGAFVGGLILNIMPCVLPVLALKVLGFVRKSQESPTRVRQLGIIYGFGVLTSFLVLAGIAIGIQKAGGIAGWGTLFQNPVFRAVMVVLITLVSLNLFGLFEVSLGSTLSAAGALTRKEGAAGAFFNGVLATLLATPCTAPFLGAALAFAFAQPPLIIILTFLTIGLGLASPFVLLCWHPAFLKLLPKPGDWMLRFKVLMGFPMLATALWLFWATAPRFGKTGVLWFGLFLVAVALSAYIWGEFVQRGAARKGLGMAAALLVVAGSYSYMLENNLHWRQPGQHDSLQWQAWSTDAVDKARAAGHPVLVDFTADTCINCQVNKATSIDIASTREHLKEIGAVTLEGDYTDENKAIAEVLSQYKRDGVPLVLVYPKDPAKPPIVLPTILTPGIVANALTEAARP